MRSSPRRHNFLVQVHRRIHAAFPSRVPFRKLSEFSRLVPSARSVCLYEFPVFTSWRFSCSGARLRPLLRSFLFTSQLLRAFASSFHATLLHPRSIRNVFPKSPAISHFRAIHGHGVFAGCRVVLPGLGVCRRGLGARDCFIFCRFISSNLRHTISLCRLK